MKANKMGLSLIMLLLISSCSNTNSSESTSNSEVSNSPVISNSTSESLSTTKPPRPHTHEMSEWVVTKEADLFHTGEKERHCLSDDGYQENDIYYDLSEVQFEDETYQYSGTQKKLTISGLLPKGIHVEYENNTQTSIGTTLAKAKFLDEDNNVVATKEAYLNVVAYMGLPRLDINTINSELINSKEVYTPSTISVSNCLSKYEMNSVSGGVRLRGNGTLEADKKPFRIKFDSKQNILGLNDGAKAKSWVLLAEYYDYSLLRNSSAFMLGDSLMDNKGYFSSDFTHVNLYVNNIFNGVYVLTEQQQVNKNRVDIYEPETNETSLDIGYLLEIDNYKDDIYFDIPSTSHSAIDSNGYQAEIPTRSYVIKSDIYANEQKEYISKYTTNVYEIFYQAVVNNCFYELDENHDLKLSTEITSQYEAINKVINVDSLFRSYILEEIIKDIDVGFSSYYLYVDFSAESKFKKMTFGAPWDFDWSSGNVDFNGKTYNTSGEYNSVHMEHMNPWLFLLSRSDFFEDTIKAYWELFTNSGVFDFVYRQIEDITVTYSQDFNRNFQKWDVLGKSLHVYHSSDVYNIHSHEDASDYLKNWLSRRIDYLNTIW